MLANGHSTVPHTPREETEERRFALALARRLERARAAHAFASLVLVMPPRSFGQVWGVLDAPTRDLVVQHVGRDLLHLPNDEVEQRVLAELGEAPISKRRMRTWIGGRPT